MSEAEPRRSVRSTKGQHKSLDQLDQPAEPKKRSKKANKKEEEEDDGEEDEVRCICGVTTQEEDEELTDWVSCEKCNTWQHNICMDITTDQGELDAMKYLCEKCKPENHQKLLADIARGDKPWIARRAKWLDSEDNKAKSKKKKKGGKKGAKAKRQSDVAPESSQTSQKAADSPAPEVKKEAKGATSSKRKSRGLSEDAEDKPNQKLRKVSDTEAVPVPPESPLPFYEPPADIPQTIKELLDTRQKPANGLFKSITTAMEGLDKESGVKTTSDDIKSRAERFALQVERAVFDGQEDYNAQIKTLVFNLKKNFELVSRLNAGTLTPPMLAGMSTDDMLSEQARRETAEMKARAEKQSILVTEDDRGPRVRRTHKGDELVETDNNAARPTEEQQAQHRPRASISQRASISGATTQSPGGPNTPTGSQARGSPAKDPLRVDTQQSNKFDLKGVLSNVRSPSAHQRRPSQQATTSIGPGDDPEVDRMLQDEALLDQDREESPPYSPSAETEEPDVVWKGRLIMTSIADVEVKAKYIAGANLSQTIKMPWTELMPRNLVVAGRIMEQKATEYLCGLRYSQVTDVTVARLIPSSPMERDGFFALIEYFSSKGRYAVVGDKGAAGVRDTYLVPVPPGSGNDPEFMLNLEDNHLASTREEPDLLLVVVYQNTPADLEKLRAVQGSNGRATAQTPGQGAPTPTPTPTTAYGHRPPSISGPTFSPTTPQVPFHPPPGPNHAKFPPQSPLATQPPYGPPQVQHTQPPGGPGPQHPVQAAVVPTQQQPRQPEEEQRNKQAYERGVETARRILGPLINAPTVAFILPQAHQMLPLEWGLIKTILEEDVRAREDVNHLSALIDSAGEKRQKAEFHASQGQMQHGQSHPGLAYPGTMQHGQMAPTLAQGQHHAPTRPSPAHQPPPPHGAPVPRPISETPIPIPQIPHAARSPPAPPSQHGLPRLGQPQQQAPPPPTVPAAPAIPPQATAAPPS